MDHLKRTGALAMKVLRFLTDLVSIIRDEWEIQSKYGISTNMACWLRRQERIPGFVKNLDDVPDWYEKRGVYVVSVDDADREWMNGNFSVNTGVSVQVDSVVRQALATNYPFYRYVFVHVYENGYNHKVVVSDGVDPNFHVLPNYLTYSQDHCRMHFVMYTSDFKSLISQVKE